MCPIVTFVTDECVNNIVISAYRVWRNIIKIKTEIGFKINSTVSNNIKN